jgi:hypothetical protein
MSVYTGKLNWEPQISNENVFVVLLDGWVERGRVLVFTTFTKDTRGVERRPFDLTTQYVLRASDTDVKKFTIRDLDNQAYYWFHAFRGTNVITLHLYTANQLLAQNIELTKLTK